MSSVMLQGGFDFNSKISGVASVLSVTGGTGAYAGASGESTLSLGDGFVYGLDACA